MAKFKIPKIFDFSARRAEKARAIELEAQAIRARNQATTELLKAVTKMVGPTRSLNDELYGNSNQPYANKIWNSTPSEARRLSRIAYYDSPAAQSMISRFVDLVYGPKLDLQSAPVWDIIPENYTDEQKTQIVKNIESRYRLWCKSKKSDYIEEKSHYQRSRQDFESLLLDGEYFVLLRYPATRKRNPLQVQILKPEDLCKVDSKVAIGNTEVDGIEYNPQGKAVAYHILTSDGKSKRVPKYGPKSGRQFVIHNKLGNGRRGVGILAGIITELTKLADFQALEIQAAVVNALFAVWVETQPGGENKPLLKNTAIGETNFDPETGQRTNISNFETQLKTTQMQTGGIVGQPGEGQKMHSFDTKRPTPGFGEFMREVKKNLFSAKSMSIAVADFDFNGSYSAARGELLVFWNKVLQLRFDHSTDYEDIIYKMWLMGEIEKGNIDMPGFMSDETIQDAWSNAHWTGPARPDIDPKRSFDAHKGEIDEGLKTRQQVTSERGGGDHDENVERLRVENQNMAEVNRPLVELDKTTYSNSFAKTESKSESKTIDNSGGE